MDLVKSLQIYKCFQIKESHFLKLRGKLYVPLQKNIEVTFQQCIVKHFVKKKKFFNLKHRT